jgi:TRAP-type C4-dicarboxylate transport system permease small subunit
VLRRLVDGLTLVGGWTLLVYSAAVGVEIVGRRYLGFSLQGVDEIGGYVMAVVVALGFSCALYDQAHIRIDLLLPRLPPRLAMWLNVLALSGLLAFAGFLVARAWDVLSDSHRMDATSSTPLLTPMVYPQALWVGGLLLFALVALTFLLRAVHHALRGDVGSVSSLIGSSAGRTTPSAATRTTRRE